MTDGMEPMDEHERIQEAQERLLYKFSIMEATHQMIHVVENEPEVNAFVTLGHRDAVMVALALAWLSVQYPCLSGLSQELQLRLIEVLDAQRPEWGGEQESTQEASE